MAEEARRPDSPERRAPYFRRKKTHRSGLFYPESPTKANPEFH
nr:MAG TPA: hypothetical protein [Caudoviricetes sp.]